MDIIYNNTAVILASAMVSAVSVSPSEMMKVKLDHIIHTRFSFFLCFLSPKFCLSQWNPSGLFFPSIHSQRYTASSWPFLGEGLKIHPLQSCFLGAAEIMEDTVPYSFLLSFLDCLFASHIKVLNSCMADEPLELRIQNMEDPEARRTLDRFLGQLGMLWFPEVIQKPLWICMGAWQICRGEQCSTEDSKMLWAEMRWPRAGIQAWTAECSSSKPLLDQLVPYARGLWFVAGFFTVIWALCLL